MVDPKFLRCKFDRSVALKQMKKDEKFAPPLVFAREPTAEELRRERDRKYLDENFPDLKNDDIVGVDDL